MVFCCFCSFSLCRAVWIASIGIALLLSCYLEGGDAFSHSSRHKSFTHTDLHFSSSALYFASTKRERERDLYIYYTHGISTVYIYIYTFVNTCWWWIGSAHAHGCIHKYIQARVSISSIVACVRVCLIVMCSCKNWRTYHANHQINHLKIVTCFQVGRLCLLDSDCYAEDLRRSSSTPVLWAAKLGGI